MCCPLHTEHNRLFSSLKPPLPSFLRFFRILFRPHTFFPMPASLHKHQFRHHPALQKRGTNAISPGFKFCSHETHSKYTFLTLKKQPALSFSSSFFRTSLTISLSLSIIYPIGVYWCRQIYSFTEILSNQLPDASQTVLHVY